MKRTRMDMPGRRSAGLVRLVLGLGLLGSGLPSVTAQEGPSLNYHTQGRTPFAERAPGWWLDRGARDEADQPIRTASHTPRERLPQPLPLADADSPAAPLPGMEHEARPISFHRAAGCGCAHPAPVCTSAPVCAAPAPVCHQHHAPSNCGCAAPVHCHAAPANCGCAAKTSCGCRQKGTCKCAKPRSCCTVKVTLGRHGGCTGCASRAGCTSMGHTTGSCANGHCPLGTYGEAGERILGEKVIGEKVIRERRLDDHLPPPPVPSRD